MRCMTKTKAHKDKNPTTRKYHNLVPEMARVGIQIWHVTYGVLHNWYSAPAGARLALVVMAHVS